MAGENKLLAEWFLTDRWIGSSGFLLPMEPKGLYREMLTQAWRRGARLPNDPEAIRRACGATPGEWRRCWPKVSKFWRVLDGHLVNDTQLEIYAEARARADRASERGASGRRAQLERVHAGGAGPAQAGHKPGPPSPSPTGTATETEDDDGTRARGDTPPAPVDEAKCPDCKATGTLRRGKGDGGWFCGTRLGGCNAQFRLDDPAILDQLGPHVRASIENRVARAPATSGSGHRRPTAAEQTVEAVRQVAAEAAEKKRR